MQRKLILSCSKRKSAEKALLPAIERYDGNAFRLLRRFLRNSSEKLDIYVLSAEFGLISHLEKIPFYDRKMNQLRAQELKKTVPMQAKKLITESNLKQNYWFINIGSLYRDALGEDLSRLETAPNIAFASGSSGRRLAEMYDWLYGQNSPLRNENNLIKKYNTVCFRGIEINLTVAEIIKIAKQNLENADKNAFSFHSWFVKIGKTKVSPKWLVSKLTGVPVGSFHSDEARKLLRKLGMNVIRN